MAYVSCDEESMYNWTHTNPQQLVIPAHDSSVITALLISHGRILTASDNHEIHVYSSTTGQLIHNLTGHEGGVWTLAVSPNFPDILVSGSTDSTMRIWDLSIGKCTYVFGGHTSTIRTLKIVSPTWISVDGRKEKWPKRSLIVTGSRDHTLRVWKLPRNGHKSGKPVEFPEPENNPYHLYELKGHTDAVRDIAAHENIAVSASYDTTVKVWNLVTGECKWTLEGHASKVYTVAIDPERNQVISGSMDGSARIWSLEIGQLLHTLTDHTSLVNFLAVSSNNLFTASADSTGRVWDPATGALKQKLEAHTGAITCFQYDECKVLTGSDGELLMWDIREGKVIKKLITGVTGVWQVAYEGNLCVAATNRAEQTCLEILNFGKRGIGSLGEKADA